MTLGSAACGDLLTETPKGFPVTEEFYQTGDDLNNATIAVYSALRALQDFTPWTTYELASDQTRHDVREPNAGTYGPDYLDWSATVGRTDEPYHAFWGLITRANLVIAHGPDVATTNDELRRYNIAEARLLRGYAYLVLTKTYGDMPLLLTPAEQADPAPSRTPVEDVHDAIIDDLTHAEAVLPDQWPATIDGVPTRGRVTKAAARMVLADLYVWRSSTLAKDEWQQAADRARQVIDDPELGLNSDYVRTFLPSAKGNREMIFFITNTGAEDRTSTVFQLFYYPRDWGLDAGEGGGWGLIHPTDWHWNSYLPGDYRKEAGHLSGGCSVSGECLDRFADGPMPYKYRMSNQGADWSLGDVDVPLYRYAEAVLIYAEAQNELGNAQEAVSYLNRIRARARQGTGHENRANPADYDGPMDKLSLREAIYMERNWELAYEAKRWFDLVRRDGLEPGYWKTSLEQHDPNAPKNGPVLEHKKLWPIPHAQIEVNPNLSQNPGY